MFRVAAVITAIACWLPVTALAATSKDVLFADRASQPRGVQVEEREDKMAIEICADSCDVYSAGRVKSESEVWDVVLLHRAFFALAAKAKAFRAKYASHVSSVMATYADKCAKYPQDVTRAVCIVKYLAKRNRIAYASVRYEAGQRCETAGELLADGPATGKRKCERAKPR